MEDDRAGLRGQQNMTGPEAVERNAKILAEANVAMNANRSEYRKEATGYPDPVSEGLLKDVVKGKAYSKNLDWFLKGFGRVIQGDV